MKTFRQYKHLITENREFENLLRDIQEGAGWVGDSTLVYDYLDGENNLTILGTLIFYAERGILYDENMLSPEEAMGDMKPSRNAQLSSIGVIDKWMNKLNLG